METAVLIVAFQYLLFLDVSGELFVFALSLSAGARGMDLREYEVIDHPRGVTLPWCGKHGRSRMPS
jgi:hypothetical protein